jgi:hypothetical protein
MQKRAATPRGMAVRLTITVGAGFPLGLPVFQRKVRHALKFVGVMSDDGHAMREGGGGNQQVMWANQFSPLFKRSPQLSIYFSGRVIEWQGLKQSGKCPDKRNVLLASAFIPVTVTNCAFY